MKRIPTPPILAIAVLLIIFPLISHSQIAPLTQKTFQGQLIKTDTAAKTITIRGIEEKEIKEMSFTYTDTTEVVGADKTVQGLSGTPGVSVRVTYRFDRGMNEAIRIETIGK